MDDLVLSSRIVIPASDGETPLLVLSADGIDCPNPHLLTGGGIALWKRLKEDQEARQRDE